MKKIFVSALVFGTTAFGVSQEVKFGVKGGLNLGGLRGDVAITEFDDVESRIRVIPGTKEGKVGFHIGGFVEYPINDKLVIQPELLISTQGAKFENTFVYYRPVLNNYVWTNIKETTVFQQKVNLAYISLPIMVKYNIYDKFNVEFGPQFGILFGGKTKNLATTFYDNGDPVDYMKWDISVTKDYIESVGNDSRTFKKLASFDFGLNFGASYNISDNFFIQARYNLGLTDVKVFNAQFSNLDVQQRFKRHTLKNSNLQFSVGYKF